MCFSYVFCMLVLSIKPLLVYEIVDIVDPIYDNRIYKASWTPRDSLLVNLSESTCLRKFLNVF